MQWFNLCFIILMTICALVRSNEIDQKFYELENPLKKRYVQMEDGYYFLANMSIIKNPDVNVKMYVPVFLTEEDTNKVLNQELVTRFSNSEEENS